MNGNESLTAKSFNETPCEYADVSQLEEGEHLIRPVWMDGVRPNKSGTIRHQVAFKFANREDTQASWRNYNLDRMAGLAAWKRHLRRMGGVVPTMAEGDIDGDGKFSTSGIAKIEDAMEEVVNRGPLMKARVKHKKGTTVDEETGQLHVFVEIALLEQVDKESENEADR